MPNGRDVSFVRVSADTPATSTLMRRAWDGSSDPVALLRHAAMAGGRGATLGPAAWLPGGRAAIMRVAGKSTNGRGAPPGDLMRWSLDAPTKLDTVIATEYSESNPAVSPDGQLLAFTSDESGRGEVYVRPLVGGALRRVSLNGGGQPKWARSGRVLFYVNSDTLFASDIRGGTDLNAGEVRVVFLARNIGLGYGVLPGDSAFVTPAAPAANLVVVTNFAAALDRLFAKRTK